MYWIFLVTLPIARTVLEWVGVILLSTWLLYASYIFLFVFCCAKSEFWRCAKTAPVICHNCIHGILLVTVFAIWTSRVDLHSICKCARIPLMLFPGSSFEHSLQHIVILPQDCIHVTVLTVWQKNFHAISSSTAFFKCRQSVRWFLV